MVVFHVYYKMILNNYYVPFLLGLSIYQYAEKPLGTKILYAISELSASYFSFYNTWFDQGSLR